MRHSSTRYDNDNNFAVPYLSADIRPALGELNTTWMQRSVQTEEVLEGMCPCSPVVRNLRVKTNWSKKKKKIFALICRLPKCPKLKFREKYRNVPGSSRETTAAGPRPGLGGNDRWTVGTEAACRPGRCTAVAGRFDECPMGSRSVGENQ